jgi:hypothetical protein
MKRFVEVARRTRCFLSPWKRKAGTTVTLSKPMPLRLKGGRSLENRAPEPRRRVMETAAEETCLRRRSR